MAPSPPVPAPRCMVARGRDTKRGGVGAQHLQHSNTALQSRLCASTADAAAESQNTMVRQVRVVPPTWGDEGEVQGFAWC